MISDHDRNCNCLECTGNHFDWNDLQIAATKYLGYATGNTGAVAAAESARQIKDVVVAEQKKVAAGGTTLWTNLPKETPSISPVDLAPKNVSVNWLGFMGPLKVVLFIALAVVLLGVFLRVSGK